MVNVIFGIGKQEITFFGISSLEKTFIFEILVCFSASLVGFKLYYLLFIIYFIIYFI